MADPEIVALRAMLATRPRPAALSERRIRLDTLAAATPVPPDVRVEPVDAGGVPGEWTATPLADPSRVMLFLHGGAYVSGSIVSHRPLVAEAGRQAGVRTLALGYRLAPEHPHPAALQDALSGYRFLLGRGVAPERIALAGDSAGGGLTLATMVALREAGDPLPGCAWCISPWVDLRMTGDSMVDRAAVDPMISKPYLEEVAALYAGERDPATPMISPLNADLHGLPPILVQVGTAETLLDDAVRLVRKAAVADVAITLEVYPDMIHVWPLFHSQLAAGRRALESAGRFLRAKCGAG